MGSLGSSWGFFGGPWGVLGGPWGVSGCPWGDPGESLGVLGCSLGASKKINKTLMFKAFPPQEWSFRRLGAPWGPGADLEGSCGLLGRALGDQLGVVRRSFGCRGPSRNVRWTLRASNVSPRKLQGGGTAPCHCMKPMVLQRFKESFKHSPGRPWVPLGAPRRAL